MNIDLRSALQGPHFWLSTDIETPLMVASFVSELDRDQLGAELEALAADRAYLERIADRCKEAESIISDALLGKLGAGEVQQLPSGRLAFRGSLSAGKSKVKEDVITRADVRAQLPADLKPTKVWKLPSVTAINAAAKAGRIPRALANKLIDRPEKVDGLQFRTLNTTTED